LKGFCVNETTIAYNSQKSDYLAKCWNLTIRLYKDTVAKLRLVCGGASIFIPGIKIVAH